MAQILKRDSVMRRYQAIACASYDVLEIAIMRRQRLQARWRDTGHSRCCAGIIAPLDLKVREGAEWLIARDSEGNKLELRLDALESAIILGDGSGVPS